MFKEIWDKILSWGRNSATILGARIQSLTGLILAAATAIDWANIARLDWAHDKTALMVGLGLMANGILTEVARRHTLDA